jgi:DNA-binding transcriptional ArsR family regulator
MLDAASTLSLVHDPEQAANLIDPSRRELLERLHEPGSAASLARELGLPRQRVNYHLRALERAGLVSCVAEQRKGNCTERMMRATARAFVLSPEVLGGLGLSPGASADRASAVALVGAAAETIRSVAALERKAVQEGKRFATLSLEATVRFASAEARAAFAVELTDAVAALVARFHDDRAPAGRTFRLVVGTHPTAPAQAPSTGADHD